MFDITCGACHQKTENIISVHQCNKTDQSRTKDGTPFFNGNKTLRTGTQLSKGPKDGGNTANGQKTTTCGSPIVGHNNISKPYTQSSEGFQPRGNTADDVANSLAPPRSLQVQTTSSMQAHPITTLEHHKTIPMNTSTQNTESNQFLLVTTNKGDEYGISGRYKQKIPYGCTWIRSNHDKVYEIFYIEESKFLILEIGGTKVCNIKKDDYVLEFFTGQECNYEQSSPLTDHYCNNTSGESSHVISSNCSQYSVAETENCSRVHSNQSSENPVHYSSSSLITNSIDDDVVLAKYCPSLRSFQTTKYDNE